MSIALRLDVTFKHRKLFTLWLNDTSYSKSVWTSE